MTRRDFMKAAGAAGAAMCARPARAADNKRDKPAARPNILFALADDWSWPHAGPGGQRDKVVKTPTFDRVVKEGVLFEQAYVTAPSCSPSRASVLTGQWHWRLEEGVNLHGTLPAKFDVYPDVLEKAGYHVGYTRKGWGPGSVEAGGRERNPAGTQYEDFAAFLKARPAGRAFCFWFGSHDPHRGYERQSGARSGMKLEDAAVPACLPDCGEVRTDICDYYWEVQRFDRETGELLKMLEEAGELDNTLVVMSGDNGLPFPRCKCNLYDTGTHVPLAVRWPCGARGGRAVKDFVSLADLAPTFLEAAGLDPRKAMPAMTAKSFLDVLVSSKSGQVDKKRTSVLTGRERHTVCQEGGTGGYPMRSIRTHDFLYIRNFKPDRWPAGSPDPQKVPEETPYQDIDASPTKRYMMDHKDDPKIKRLFELAFTKRPGEELYDLKKDPDQLDNVARQPKYAETKKKLADMLIARLKATKDPRVVGGADAFEKYPYGRAKRPRKKKPRHGARQ